VRSSRTTPRKDNTMKFVVDYKDPVSITKAFLVKRKRLMSKGIPPFVVEAALALKMAYPFSGKEVLDTFELDLNARIVLTIVQVMTNFTNN
jgi:hypothetical protein